MFDMFDMDRFIEKYKQEGADGNDLSSEETRPDDGDAWSEQGPYWMKYYQRGGRFRKAQGHWIEWRPSGL